MSRARTHKIKLIERRLRRRRWPRFQVSLILAGAALAGFLTSFSLLHAGIMWMWLRYFVAIFVAYGVFLLLLRLWLWLQRHSINGSVDLPDLEFSHSAASGQGAGFHFGGGGDFGGGGAGGSWAGGAASSSSLGGSSFANSISIDLDLQEGWLLVLAIGAIIGGLIASFYIIYIAPGLLAEILVDGALVAGLYKRVKHIEQGNWLRAAVRRTVVPAILAALFFTLAGYALQKAAPHVYSIGGVWSSLRQRVSTNRRASYNNRVQPPLPRRAFYP